MPGGFWNSFVSIWRLVQQTVHSPHFRPSIRSRTLPSRYVWRILGLRTPCGQQLAFMGPKNAWRQGSSLAAKQTLMMHYQVFVNCTVNVRCRSESPSLCRRMLPLPRALTLIGDSLSKMLTTVNWMPMLRSHSLAGISPV